MPRGDGTGPAGQGPGTGGGMGGRGGGGRGRMGGSGGGPGGQCVCPRCGKTFPHQRGVPCFQMKCSSCGVALTRPR